MECPHLLPSCLRNTSKAVQTNVTIPDGVSATRMEWSWLPYFGSAFKLTHYKSCFALSPDKKLLAEGNGKCISLFDSFSLKRLLGPIEVKEAEENIKHVAFCPGGNFVFFGRLDKWFSVERGCVEEISQFSGNNRWCKWGSFTLNEQHIVVKRRRVFPHNWMCLLNYLCLWAKEEITHNQTNTLCRWFLHKLTLKRVPHTILHRCITAMRPLIDLLRRMRCNQWCSLLEKVELKGLDVIFLSDKCQECKLRKYDTLTLTEVRQYIIDHYSEIFAIQVWDVQTGKPVLERAFSSGVQPSTFTMLCHLSTAFETCGTLFTNTDKALSFCNIALFNVICYHHLFRLECRLAIESVVEGHDSFGAYFPPSCFRRFLSGESNWVVCIEGKTVLLFRHGNQNPVYVIREVRNCILFNDQVFLYSTVHKTLHALCLHTGNTTLLSVSLLADFVHDFSKVENKRALEMLVLSTFSSTMPIKLQNLPNEEMKAIFSGHAPCMSPGGMWIATPLGSKDTVHLFRVRDQHQQHSENSTHVIKEVAQFAFAKLNGNSFFLYLTFDDTLHALSLQTGKMFLSELTPLFFVPERQVGYFVHADDEDATVFLKDLPSCFISSLFCIPDVERPIRATFLSADTILVLFCDSELVMLRTTGDETARATVSKKSFLTGGRHERQYVEKGSFSPDGKLIATHQGTTISLHSTTESAYGGFLCSIFEAAYIGRVVHFTFSTSSTLLAFSILGGNNCPYILTYVWDVQKKVITASFESQGLLSEDFCCCFSSDNKKLVLCTELFIEIWDHVARPCCLLTRMATHVLYNEDDRFTHCAMSQEDNLLACCIVDKILLYSLNNPTNQPFLELPRAHLGKIQFCQILRGNRYIISYGVDGVVFLWDLNKRSAVSYARIAQGRESIVIMTVSPEEDMILCFTSFQRFYVIKLCRLKFETPFLQFKSQGMIKEHNAATFQGATCSGVEACAEDPVDISKLMEEINFMLPSDDDSDGSDNDG